MDLRPRPDGRRAAVEVDQDHEHVENGELHAQAVVLVLVVVDPDHGIHAEAVLDRHHRHEHCGHENSDKVHSEGVVLCVDLVGRKRIRKRLVNIHGQHSKPQFTAQQRKLTQPSQRPDLGVGSTPTAAFIIIGTPEEVVRCERNPQKLRNEDQLEPAFVDVDRCERCNGKYIKMHLQINMYEVSLLVGWRLRFGIL